MSTGHSILNLSHLTTVVIILERVSAEKQYIDQWAVGFLKYITVNHDFLRMIPFGDFQEAGLLLSVSSTTATLIDFLLGQGLCICCIHPVALCDAPHDFACTLSPRHKTSDLKL